MSTLNTQQNSVVSRRLRLSILILAFAVPHAIAEETPGKGNSISGVVRVLDRNGTVLGDHSNVVVFVDGLPNSALHRNLQHAPQISHKNREFSPAVLPIVQGTTVDFFNDDSIFHNVFSLSVPKTFDLGIYAEGTSKLVTFSESGLVKLYCNIHPQMTSTILVLHNNLFAKTGPDGRFHIDNVPDGDITLRAWSTFSDEQERIISLTGGMHIEESFELQQTKTFVQHRNKFGKRYREKY